jgi:hypothetical protein
LASARIIQFAPYFLARKQEQKAKRLLARLIRPSPLGDCDDIRAWVATQLEWSAAVSSSHEAPAPISTPLRRKRVRGKPIGAWHDEETVGEGGEKISGRNRRNDSAALPHVQTKKPCGAALHRASGIEPAPRRAIRIERGEFAKHNDAVLFSNSATRLQ